MPQLREEAALWAYAQQQQQAGGPPATAQQALLLGRAGTPAAPIAPVPQRQAPQLTAAELEELLVCHVSAGGGGGGAPYTFAGERASASPATASPLLHHGMHASGYGMSAPPAHHAAPGGASWGHARGGDDMLAALGAAPLPLQEGLLSAALPALSLPLEALPSAPSSTSPTPCERRQLPKASSKGAAKLPARLRARPTCLPIPTLLAWACLPLCTSASHVRPLSH